MKHKLLIGVLMAVTMLTTALVGVTTAEAANGQEKGLYGFPGNSIWGRSHNPNFMYKWGNEEFADIDELLEYIREYMETWKRLHQGEWKNQNKYKKTTTSSTYIVTRSAQDIEEDSAELRGKVNIDDDESAEVWFVYGTRSSDLDEKTKELTIDDEDDEEFSIDVTGLDEDTRYYYRAVAEDENGKVRYGATYWFRTDDDDGDDADDDTPEISTLSAQDITDDEATIRGKVDMNDFEDGLVFFVYGTDEDAVEDVEDEDTYADIDEDGDNLQVLKMNGSFDGYGTWVYDLEDLDDDTMYYFRIGLEYEDEDGGTKLVFGSVKRFTTEE